MIYKDVKPQEIREGDKLLLRKGKSVFEAEARADWSELDPEYIRAYTEPFGTLYIKATGLDLIQRREATQLDEFKSWPIGATFRVRLTPTVHKHYGVKLSDDHYAWVRPENSYAGIYSVADTIWDTQRADYLTKTS